MRVRPASRQKPRRKKNELPPPTKLKMGFSDFRVVPITATKADKLKIRGETDANQNKIRYDETLPSKDMAAVIIHECLHACAWVCSIKFPNDDAEEIYVDAFANALAALFRDNPSLLLWLYSSLAEVPSMTGDVSFKPNGHDPAESVTFLQGLDWRGMLADMHGLNLDKSQLVTVRGLVYRHPGSSKPYHVSSAK